MLLACFLVFTGTASDLPGKYGNVRFKSAPLGLKLLSPPGLTRVRSTRFLLIKIKRVLVNNSTIFKLADLII